MAKRPLWREGTKQAVRRLAEERAVQQAQLADMPIELIAGELNRRRQLVTGAAMPTHTWVFQARLVRVVDGDTQYIEIDQGMHTRRIESLRLLGVDTPETRGETKAAGDAATAWVRGWYEQATGEWPLVVETYKADSFGRYLGLVWVAASGRCLNDDLLASGHAVMRQ